MTAVEDTRRRRAYFPFCAVASLSHEEAVEHRESSHRFCSG